MNNALWIFGVIAVLFSGLSVFCFDGANRSGDDFGSGVLFWLCLVIAVVAVVVWVILAAIHWWPV